MSRLYFTGKKRIAAAACACLALLFLLSLTVIILHFGHECHGLRCETCLYVSNSGKGLRLLSGAPASASAPELQLICMHSPRRNDCGGEAAPVALRVQLNN